MALATFADPVHDAQATFRCALAAMARPTQWQLLPVKPDPMPGLTPASTALALTLLDHDVTAWLGAAARRAANDLRLACGVALVDEPAAADFALVTATELDTLAIFASGSAVAPETATTVVLEVDDHQRASGLTCSGPGLAEPSELHCSGLPPTFADQWHRQTEAFPCGVDVFLVTADRVAALPRTVQLEEAPCTPQ